MSNRTREEKLQFKEEFFQNLKQAYQDLVKQQWDGIDYFAVWMTGELNNAHLALMNSYEGGHCAFAALYDEAGQDIPQFYRLAEQKARLEASQRTAWLNQPCSQQVLAAL